jgi:hypothetical protein
MHPIYYLEARALILVAVTPLPSANVDPLVWKPQILSICTHITNLQVVKTKYCCWLLLLVLLLVAKSCWVMHCHAYLLLYLK